ncbi:MAG: hypothetical protein ACT4R6_06290 [Gemmatimonadaceae bacterium]
MDCRTFRKKHALFVDETLPGVEHNEMIAHVGGCLGCAAHDSRVRRAMLLARSLQPIKLSHDFADRLRARLDVERKRLTEPIPLARGPSLSVFAGMAACVVAVGIFAAQLQRYGTLTESSSAPAQIANISATEDSSFASSSALAAAVSTSAPIWSLAYLADEVPLRFATARLAESAIEP